MRRGDGRISPDRPQARSFHSSSCGSTLRITPVLRISIVLTTGVFELERIEAEPVVIGISLPTCSSAGWLSRATIDGEERTLTLVIASSALRMARGCAVRP